MIKTTKNLFKILVTTFFVILFFGMAFFAIVLMTGCGENGGNNYCTICGKNPSICDLNYDCAYCNDVGCIKCIPPLCMPTNVRIESDAISGWVLRWNAASPVNQYQVEILNTYTNQASQIGQSGTTHQLAFIIAPDVLYTLRVRAIISLPSQTAGWSASVNFGIPVPDISFYISATFGNVLRDVQLPVNWSWVSPQLPVGNVSTIPTSFYANYHRIGGWIPVVNIPLTFTVSRATPVVSVPNAVLAIEGEFLRDTSLPAGWSWSNANALVDTVGEIAVAVIYSRNDNNWNTVSEWVSVTVIALPTPTAVFGQHLAEIDNLPIGWTWDSPSSAVGDFGTRVHSATYARPGFVSLTRMLSVAVSRATPIVDTPNDIDVYAFTALDNHILPSNWTWNASQSDDGSVGDVGRRSFLATYRRGNNYNPVQRNIYVNVQGVKFQYIAVSSFHNMALDEQGRIWAWGAGSAGRLGIGSNANINRPILVTQAYNGELLPRMHGIATGGAFSMALDENGGVWAWGNNHRGQVGNGNTNDINRPVRISQTLFEGALPIIIAISAGNAHSMAIDIYNRVWAWGSNMDPWNTANGKLGDGGLVNRVRPVRISQTIIGDDLPTIVSISASTNHTTALDIYGDVWVWGNTTNFSSIATIYATLRPMRVTGLPQMSKVIAYANGYSGGSQGMSTGLDMQGRMWQWNYFGSYRVDATLNLPEIIYISHGANHHMIAIDSYNRIWAWGSNGNGRLGDGTTNNSPVPVLITQTLNEGALPPIARIRVSSNHSVALDIYGRIWTWGANDGFRLGDGTNTNRHSPIRITSAPVN